MADTVESLKRTRWIVFGLLAVLYAVVQASLFSWRPEINYDSHSYLQFSPKRTLGYPVVLGLVGQQGAVVLQFVGLIVSAVGAAGLMTAVSRTVLAGAAVLVFVGVNSAILVLAGQIGTDEPFLVLTTAAVCGLCMAFRTGRLTWLLCASIAAGLAMTVRPSGWALAPVLAIGAITIARTRTMSVRRTGLLLVCGLVPMLAIGGAERVAAHAVFGPRLVTLAGRHFWTKAALLPPLAGPHPRIIVGDPLQQMLEDRLRAEAPDGRLLAGAPTLTTRLYLQRMSEILIIYTCATAVPTVPQEDEPGLSRAMLAVGLRHLALQPFDALQGMAFNDLGGWYPFTTAQMRRDVLAYTSTSPESGRGACRIVHAPVVSSRGPIEVMNVVFAASGIVTILFALGGFYWAWTNVMTSLAFLGWTGALTAQSLTILTALTAPGGARFTHSIWPEVALAVVAIGVMGVRSVLIRLPARYAPASLFSTLYKSISWPPAQPAGRPKPVPRQDT